MSQGEQGPRGRRKPGDAGEAAFGEPADELAAALARAEEAERRLAEAFEDLADLERRYLFTLRVAGGRPFIEEETDTLGRQLKRAVSGARDAKEDRRLVAGSDLFDPIWYARRYSLGQADPLDDFMRRGLTLTRDPGPKFNSFRYLEDNPDVVATGRNPLVHYLRFGRAEKRPIYPAAPKPGKKPAKPKG